MPSDPPPRHPGPSFAGAALRRPGAGAGIPSGGPHGRRPSRPRLSHKRLGDSGRGGAPKPRSGDGRPAAGGGVLCLADLSFRGGSRGGLYLANHASSGFGRDLNRGAGMH